MSQKPARHPSPASLPEALRIAARASQAKLARDVVVLDLKQQAAIADYFDFIVHVFSVEKRLFYGLERIWGSAERIEIPDSQG
jgi:ribosomal silencing factor RsfS